MKKRKYRKSTHSNPQQSNEPSTLEGPEQREKIKSKDVKMLVVVADFVHCILQMYKMLKIPQCAVQIHLGRE